MRIAIATFPIDLSSNYGCVLQNFALQEVLRRLGHHPVTIRLNNLFPAKESLSLFHRLWLKKNKNQYAQQELFRAFCERHISFTEAQSLPIPAAVAASWNFDAYISGSDQIWRSSHSQQYFLRYAMLDFTGNLAVKRLAYAISFGHVKWSWPRRLLFRRLSKLVSKYDVLAMREDDGVEICRKFLRQDKIQKALDPTLLLDGDAYLEVSRDGRDASSQLLMYFIDESSAKREAANRLFNSGKFCGKQDFSTKPGQGIIQPRMEDWLAAFRTARFVMTDSFHGTVFAILYKKPFITIANSARGLSRFTSLLGSLQLSERLLQRADDFKLDLCEAPIDFQTAHSLLALQRRDSLGLLQQGLAGQ